MHGAVRHNRPAEGPSEVDLAPECQDPASRAQQGVEASVSERLPLRLRARRGDEDAVPLTIGIVGRGWQAGPQGRRGYRRSGGLRGVPEEERAEGDGDNAGEAVRGEVLLENGQREGDR
jgi:hypothetical protein